MGVIDDLIPLRNVQFKVPVPRKIKSARLVPGIVDLPFNQKDGVVALTVQTFTVHAMIELAYR